MISNHNYLDQAKTRAKRAGVDNLIEFLIVEPGHLPFDDNSFDTVFSKDSIVHIEDKPALFSDVRRVLRPGGLFCGSDWLGSSDAVEQAAMWEVTEGTHMHFEIATANEIESILDEAGFTEISTRDRNSWFSDLCAKELIAIEGPLYEDLVAAAGKDIVDPWIDLRRTTSRAAACGGTPANTFFWQSAVSNNADTMSRIKHS